MKGRAGLWTANGMPGRSTLIALAVCFSWGLAGCGDPGVTVYAANQSTSAVIVQAGAASVLVPPGGNGVALATAGSYKDLEIAVVDPRNCGPIERVHGFSGGPILVTITVDGLASTGLAATMATTDRKGDWLSLTDDGRCG